MGILYFTGLIKFSVQLIFAANYLKKLKRKKMPQVNVVRDELFKWIGKKFSKLIFHG